MPFTVAKSIDVIGDLTVEPFNHLMGNIFDALCLVLIKTGGPDVLFKLLCRHIQIILKCPVLLKEVLRDFVDPLVGTLG